MTAAAALASPQLLGDANMDGEVNFEDFSILASNFGRQGFATHADGDFDQDHDVDFSDFVILANHFDRPHDAASAPADSLPVSAADVVYADATVGETDGDWAAALESAIEELIGSEDE